MILVAAVCRPWLTGDCIGGLHFGRLMGRETRRSEMAVGTVIDARTEEAVSRVGMFLACLGLPADYALQRAEQLVESDAMSDDDREDRAALAVSRIASQYDAWLDTLCCSRPGDCQFCTALLAWHLRRVLHSDPELFLQPHIPEAVFRVLEGAKCCPLPEPAPAAMPDQSFVRPPDTPLQDSPRRGLAERIASWGRRLFS
jgi:hypothetical protein